MSDQEQAVLAEALEEGIVAAPLVRAREQLDTALLEDAALLDTYLARLAALVGELEATALAADPQRTPSWRL